MHQYKSRANAVEVVMFHYHFPSFLCPHIRRDKNIPLLVRSTVCLLCEAMGAIPPPSALKTSYLGQLFRLLHTAEAVAASRGRWICLHRSWPSGRPAAPQAFLTWWSNALEDGATVGVAIPQGQTLDISL